MRASDDMKKVQAFVAQGQSDYEIARRTGIPRSTVQRWRRAGPPERRRELVPGAWRCPSCRRPAHSFRDLPGGPYAYLLGQYLWRRHDLRGRDAIYKALIQECCVTIGQVRGRRPTLRVHPSPFLRGLIHSDGWRGVNRVHVKGRTYEHPRYQFSNRSDDIRQLFTYACDLIGVAWRPWGRYHISVARRESVELLDRFVGPKR